MNPTNTYLKLFQDGTMTDFEIKLHDGSTFRVHKVFLLGSKFFEDYFKNEANPKDQITLEQQYGKEEVLDAIYYIYAKELELTRSIDCIFKLCNLDK